MHVIIIAHTNPTKHKYHVLCRPLHDTLTTPKTRGGHPATKRLHTLTKALTCQQRNEGLRKQILTPTHYHAQCRIQNITTCNTKQRIPSSQTQYQNHWSPIRQCADDVQTTHKRHQHDSEKQTKRHPLPRLF